MIIRERHLGNGMFDITFTTLEIQYIVNGLAAGAAATVTSNPTLSHEYTVMHDELVALADLGGAGL